MNNNNRPLRLLPNSFKAIGGILILLGIGAAVFFKFNPSVTMPAESLKVIFMSILILGLLLIAVSRDKVEDEMSLYLRSQAMIFSFIWGVIRVVVAPFIDMLFRDPIRVPGAQEVVLSMLFVFIIFQYFLKSRQA
jgi:hypothetical protein